jgi:hypothetical protein
MKYIKTYEQKMSEYQINDFPYVVDFFKKYNKNVSNIPVYIISEEDWPDGKPRGTENDRKGGIIIHESRLENEKEIGWLIHEVGHVLDLQGERKPYLVSKKEFKYYPNEDDEQTPMLYQFTYLINKGLSEDDVINLEKKEYSDVKGGVTLWSNYKDKFFRKYYNQIKSKISSL